MAQPIPFEVESGPHDFQVVANPTGDNAWILALRRDGIPIGTINAAGSPPVLDDADELLEPQELTDVTNGLIQAVG